MMAKPYPLEMRERAVAAVIVEERPQKEVAKLFAVGKATLDRWLFLWRAGESLAAKKGKPGPAGKLAAAAAREALRAQLAATPDARLEDHRRRWRRRTGQAVSAATLWRALRALGWTRKKALRRGGTRRGRAGGLAGRARGAGLWH